MDGGGSRAHAGTGDAAARHVAEGVVRETDRDLPLAAAGGAPELRETALGPVPGLARAARDGITAGERVTRDELRRERAAEAPVGRIVKQARVHRAHGCGRAGTRAACDLGEGRRFVGHDTGGRVDRGDRAADGHELRTVVDAAGLAAADRRRGCVGETAQGRTAAEREGGPGICGLGNRLSGARSHDDARGQPRERVILTQRFLDAGLDAAGQVGRRSLRETQAAAAQQMAAQPLV